jgi:Trypsin-like peptidase domain
LQNVRLDQRFVELFSARAPGDTSSGSYGSGFLLGRAIILTARHVICPPDWAQVPSVLSITARPVRTLREDRTWLDADLVWPDREELGNQGPDVALVRVRDPLPELIGDENLPNVGFDSDDAERARHDFMLKVSSVGFPSFVFVSDRAGKESYRDSHQIVGVTKPYSALNSQTFEIDRIDFGRRRDDSGPLTSADNWVGFSGAALMSNRTVIGVVVTAANNGVFDFRAVRLEPLLARRDFATALSGAATIVGEVAAVEAPRFDNFVCLLDRVDQDSEFVAAHKLSCGSAPSAGRSNPHRPIVCLLPGAGDQGHCGEDLAERLSRRTLPGLSWPRNLTQVHWIDWPYAELEAADALARLRDSLWNAAAGGGDAPADDMAFARVWQDGSRSRVFVSDLTYVPLNARTASVLNGWTPLLAKLSPNDAWPLAHLLLMGGSYADVKSWALEALARQEAVTKLLPELTLCNQIHIKRWFEDGLPADLVERRRKDVDRLKLVLRFEKQFYYKDAKDKVQDFVQDMTNAR